MGKESIKVVAMSDLHGILPPSNTIPKCDLVLIGGDICGHHGIFDQSVWLYDTFRPWLENLPAERVVGVAGNHDFIWEKSPHLVPKLPWIYLQDNMYTYKGWKIYGSPWQLRFYDWAFNLDEPEIERKWNLIPDDVDILVLHGPPKFFGDKVTSIKSGEDGFAGSLSLTNRIRVIQPKLVVFGHIHPGFGIYEENGTILANVSLVDNKYLWKNHPVQFTLDTERKETISLVKNTSEDNFTKKVTVWNNQYDKTNTKLT